jgi:hypothetical protein
MTDAEALAKAAAHIDQLLMDRRDRLFMRLLEDGLDPDASWVFEEQQAIDQAWRTRTLNEIRAWLAAEANTP